MKILSGQFTGIFKRIFLFFLVFSICFSASTAKTSAQNNSFVLKVSQLNNEVKVSIKNNGNPTSVTYTIYWDNNSSGAIRYSAGTINKGVEYKKTHIVQTPAHAQLVYVNIVTLRGSVITSASSRIVRATPTPPPPTPTPTLAPYVDLVPSALVSTDRKITITLRNAGTKPAILNGGYGAVNTSGSSHYDIGSAVFSFSHFGTKIDPGKSTSWTFTSALPDNARFFEVNINYTKNIVESDAGYLNNKTPEQPLPAPLPTPTPTLAPYVDLVPSSIVSPDRKITITLRNAGTKTANLNGGYGAVNTYGGSHGDISSSTFMFSHFGTKIDPGKSASWTFTSVLPDAARFYNININYTKNIIESDAGYNNNKTEQQPLPAPLPTPTPTLAPYVDLVPDAVVSTDRKITITLRNAGTLSANLSGGYGAVNTYARSGSTHSDISSSTFMFSHFGTKIDPGKSASWTFTSALPDNARFFDININYTKNIVESDAGYLNNKTAEQPLPAPLPTATPTLAPYVDLVPSAVISTDRKITISLRNAGTKSANLSGGYGAVNTSGSGHHDLSSSTFMFSHFGTKIDPGKSASWTFTGNLPNDARYFTVNINYTKNIVESDAGYTNNVTEEQPVPAIIPTATPTPLQKPDLKIDSLQSSESTASFKITNIGMVAFSGTVTASSYWNTQSDNAKSSDLGALSLAPDAEVIKQVSVIPPAKTSTLHVNITTPVSEETTDNNYSRVTVTGTIPLGDSINLDALGISDELASDLDGQKVGDDAQVNPKAIAGILPGDIRYGFKDIGREIAAAFTFDSEKKIELGNKIANEKSLEVSVLIDQNNTSDAVINSAKDTAKTEEKIADALSELRKKNPTKADELTAKVIGDRLKRETVLDKLKHHIDVDDSIQVSKKDDVSLTKLGEQIGQMKNPSKIRDALDTATAANGSPFKPLRELVATNAITSHIANENAREVLEGAKEKQAEHLKNNLQNLPQKDVAFITDYVAKTSGDTVNTLKALDDVKTQVTSRTVKAALGTSRQQTIIKLVSDLKSAKAKDPKAADTMLAGLQTGSLTDLRVLSDIKTKDTAIAEDITKVKNVAITNFAKHVNSLNASEKQKYLSDISKNHLDLTQQQVINDIKKSRPHDSIGNEFDTALKTEVKTKVAKVRGNKKDYDEFVNGITGDTADDKESITAFTAGFDTNFYKDLMRQQLAYMKSFYSTADPETKKFFDQYYFNDPTIKSFYTDFDSAFDSMFSGYNVAEDNADDSSDDTGAYDSDPGTNTTSGCAMIDDPVCGKDGYNYANECEAKDNGTEVAYKGECKEESQVDENSSSDNSDNSGGGDEEVQGASTYRAPGVIPFLWHILFH